MLTWDDLLTLLQAMKAEGEIDMKCKVSFSSTDSKEYLDLVESASNGSITFIAAWAVEPTEDDDDPA